MELIDLVSELLYNKNCVIIPNFGGFVGNFKSTDFDENRLLVSPTRKRVAFNESLIENDGLLIHALQKRKGISYEQSEKEVALFASFLKDRLTKYKNYEFKNLGSLYLNKEDKLIFVAYDGANFHKKSYGLSDVKIKRLTDASATIQKPSITDHNKPKIVPIQEAPTKSRFYFPQIAASIAILSLFGVMLWQLLRTSADQPLVENTVENTSDTESTASIIPDIDLTEDATASGDTEPEIATSIKYEDITDEEITPSPKRDVAPVKEPVVAETKVTVEEPIKQTPKEVIPTIEQPKVKAPIVETIKEKTEIKTTSNDLKPFNPFTETVYYIAVAKNYTDKVASLKRTKLEKREYDVFELVTPDAKVLCIEKFISKKNAQDFLKLVKRYDDRYAFIFENEE